MKTNSRSTSPWPLMATLFTAIVAFFLIAWLTMPAPVHAAEAAGSIALVMAAATAPTEAPFWQSLITGENISWLFTVVVGLVAVFKHRDLTTSQKALRAVIVGVEEASKLPAVQAEATKIKGMIQSYAVSHGVQDQLHELVQVITEQLPPHEEPAPTATPAAPAV